MSTNINHTTRAGKLISLTALLCLIFIACIDSVYAVAPAGAIIKNQASASYRDTQGVRRLATSNVVETVIRQVAAIELTMSQSKRGTAGQKYSFTHTLINTGNGTDQFQLSPLAGRGDFSLADVAIYTDNNRDGQPDSGTSVNASPQLQAGESWSFVLAGLIPAGVLNNDSATVVVNAASVYNHSVSVSNTDTVLVTDSAVIEFSQRLSSTSGTSPDGPYTVRISYKNTTRVQATNVVVIDALPEGMSYIAGSGRWSGTGTVALADNAADNFQSGIRYCAYDASCTGLVESNAGSDSTNQVTAVISSVAAGENGYIEFDVAIQPGLPSGVLFNIAELQYTSGSEQVGRINSNPVPFTITASAGVVINGSSISRVDGTQEPRIKIDSVFGASSGLPVCQSDTADPDGDGYGTENFTDCFVQDLQAGNSLFYSNTVWNLGRNADSFDLITERSTFPPDTFFRFLKADSQTPLLDTNGNGVPDTGLIPPGEPLEIVLQVILPDGASGNNEGLPFSVVNVATSIADPSVNNTMVNLLHNITPVSADDDHSVRDNQSLQLGINQQAQVQPGSSHVYHHTLVNRQNTEVNNLSLTVTDTLAVNGFSSLLYEDTDNDGVLSPADQLITTLSVAAGESRSLFVKVYAPATASNGMSNFTELAVNAGAVTLSVTDVTNVASGTISVLKEQALDNFCDGVLDSIYSSSAFSVEPGNNCIRYRLTAFNTGSVPVLKVVVADATPTYTTYTGNAVCSQSGCTVTEPGNGGGGEVIAALPELAAGDSVVLEFMVRID